MQDLKRIRTFVSTMKKRRKTSKKPVNTEKPVPSLAFRFNIIDYRYVYVMRNLKALRCKIGISTKPYLRAQQVSDSVFGTAVVVFCMQMPFATLFEGLLHGFFDPFRRPLKGNGGTEFFSILITPFAIIGVFLMWVIAHTVLLFLITLITLWGVKLWP